MLQQTSDSSSCHFFTLILVLTNALILKSAYLGSPWLYQVLYISIPLLIVAIFVDARSQRKT